MRSVISSVCLLRSSALVQPVLENPNQRYGSKILKKMTLQLNSSSYQVSESMFSLNTIWPIFEAMWSNWIHHPQCCHGCELEPINSYGWLMGFTNSCENPKPTWDYSWSSPEHPSTPASGRSWDRQQKWRVFTRPKWGSNVGSRFLYKKSNNTLYKLICLCTCVRMWEECL